MGKWYLVLLIEAVECLEEFAGHSMLLVEINGALRGLITNHLEES